MSIHYGKNIKTRYFKGYINNFTTVGSPTFDGSVVSGFSGSNYLTLPNVFNPENNPWEMVYKFTTKDDVTTGSTITGANGNGYRHVFIYTLSSKLYFEVSSNGSNWDIGKIEGGEILPNTTYFVKAEFTGEAYNLYYSKTNSDYILIGSLETNKIIYKNELTQSIGLNRYSGGSNNPCLHSIDLKECYININGERWWDGLKRCKYDHNFTTVGTPSISNAPSCTVSGFSSAKYLTLPQNFDVSDGSTWEMVYKVRTGDNITTGQSICGHTGSGNADPVNPCIKSSKFQLTTSKSSSSNIFSDVYGTATLEANTDYFVKIVFDGSAYILSYSTDGETFIEDIRKESTTPIWASNLAIGRQQGDASEYPWLGSIDLTQSYIKINNQLWWQCFKQSDEYVYSEESTEDDYDYTVFEDGRIKELYKGALHKTTYYKNISNFNHTATSGWSNASNAFDGSADTYASCGTATDYIEIDFGKEVYINGFVATGNWVDSVARAEDLRLYTVDDSDIETLVVQSTGSAATTTYTTSANFDVIKASKIRFKLSEANYNGGVPTTQYPTRIREISISGYYESDETDYDFTKIYKGQIVLGYKGKDLIYTTYPNGVVFEQSIAGTYTLVPSISGPYEISLVGPGSGGTCAGDQASYASKSRGAGGGSGAYVKGIWNLTRGVDYTIVVGAGGPAGPTNSNNGYSQAAGDSSFGDFIVCGGGGGATAVWKGSGIGGAGGTVKTCENPIQLITRTAGNQGSAGGGYTYYEGGVSKLPPHGAGGFGQATGNYAGKSAPGENGYCKVRMLTIEPQPQKINVNFVGNVNFDNGIVSNFTTSNYLMLPETLPASDEIEFGGKISLAAKSTATKCIYEISTSSWTGFNIALDSSSRLRLWTGSQNATGSTLEANKDYWFKCLCNSTGSILYLSTDGIEYTQDITIANNQYSSWVGSNIYLGVRGYNKTEPLTNDFIDLNECYVKVNNGLWWKGIITVKPYTFTINTQLSGAVVTINGEQRNTITAMGGEFITWSLTYQGSIVESGKVLLTEDTEININIDRIEFVPWEQPIATANTTTIDGGDMIITSSSAYSGEQAYKAMDGNKTSTHFSFNSVGSGWWQVKLPYKLIIRNLTYYSRNNTSRYPVENATFYTSSDMTTQIGDSFSAPTTDYTAFEVQNIPKEGILTDTIYLTMNGSGGTCGMGELEITADKIVKIIDGE